MFNVSAEIEGRYVLVVVSGEATAAHLCASITFLSELLERTGRWRALIDMMGLHFVLDEAADRAVLGQLQRQMPALEKLAVVVPTQVSHGLIATVARAKGIDVGQFDNLPDADRWLSA